ncbi:MAG: hypothetical protein JWN27_1547, partial [Candidatus Eremiobacteraeota bacterium]|nr:hypothetical protein [Candidatus Eremiobacteraeota bacterium]
MLAVAFLNRAAGHEVVEIAEA